MANYSREEMDKNASNTKAAIGTILLSATGWALKKIAESNNKKRKEDAFRRQVAADQMKVNQINSQIKEYEGSLFGKVIYKNEINDLNNQRNDIYKKYDNNQNKK